MKVDVTKQNHTHATTGATVYSAGEVTKQRQTDAQGAASQHQCNGSTNSVTASPWAKELFPMCPILALRG